MGLLRAEIGILLCYPFLPFTSDDPLKLPETAVVFLFAFREINALRIYYYEVICTLVVVSDCSLGAAEMEMGGGSGVGDRLIPFTDSLSCCMVRFTDCSSRMQPSIFRSIVIS